MKHASNAVLLAPLARVLKGAAAAVWAPLLGRARHLPEATAGLSAQLAPSFGLQARELPWAAVLARQAGHAGAQRWLALEPLSLKVAPNGIYVLASNEFGQSLVEMQALWESTAAGLRHYDLKLQHGRQLRAFVELPEALADPDTECAEDLLGVELSMHLPALPLWRRWLGELQIEWTQHPVNQQRLSQGAMPINSPWFGRASRWIEAPTAPSRVISADPLLAALAQWSGAQCIANVSDPDSSPSSLLLDLRHDSDAALPWLRAHSGWQLRFACGARFEMSSLDRWKFWRGALPTPDSNPLDRA